MRLIKFLPVLVLLSMLSEVASQNPWLATPFKVNSQTVRMFYLDSIKGHFYIGGNIRWVDSMQVNSMFRIDSNEVVNLLDTMYGGADPPLAMIKYNDTLFQAGYYGLYAYEDSNYIQYLPDGPFFDLTIYEGDLLICGRFKQLLSNNDGLILRYDGNSFYEFNGVFNLLSDGFGGAVHTMCVYKSKLYVGGNFTENGFYELASWDGQNWDNLDGGVYPNTIIDNISDMIVYKDELYVAGFFSHMGGYETNNIVKWDGEQWIALEKGIYGQGIADMFIYRDELWVVGAFDSTRNVPMNNVAIWNGEHWCSPGSYFGFEATTLGEFRDTLYIGGNFRHIDFDSSKKYIAKYNPAAPRFCGPPVESIPLGTKKEFTIQERSIFPNPSNGMFQFSSESNAPLQVELYNTNGQLIWSTSALPNREIEIPYFVNSGFYLLRAIVNEHWRTSKFILARD